MRSVLAACHKQYLSLTRAHTLSYMLSFSLSISLSQVVRMYRTLLGEAGFKKGMVLYFERHDGGAVTCDDFRAAMAGTYTAVLT